MSTTSKVQTNIELSQVSKLLPLKELKTKKDYEDFFDED